MPKIGNRRNDLGAECFSLDSINMVGASFAKVLVDAQDVLSVSGKGMGDEAVGAIVGVIVTLETFASGVPEVQDGIKRRGNRARVCPNVQALSLLCLELEVGEVSILG